MSVPDQQLVTKSTKESWKSFLQLVYTKFKNLTFSAWLMSELSTQVQVIVREEKDIWWLLAIRFWKDASVVTWPFEWTSQTRIGGVGSYTSLKGAHSSLRYLSHEVEEQDIYSILCHQWDGNRFWDVPQVHSLRSLQPLSHALPVS